MSKSMPDEVDLPQQVRMDPVTLSYGNAAVENAFRKKRQELKVASDRLYQNANVLIGLSHTSISVYLVEGTLLSGQVLLLVLPYVAVALAHKLLTSTKLYTRNRLPFAIAAEAAYCAICTLSMPYWVLHNDQEVVNGKLYAKDFILGSGVLISYWLLFLIDIPFVHALWVLPAECAAQVLHLAPATCRVLDGMPYGRQMSVWLAEALQQALAVVLPSSPASSNPCIDLVTAWQISMCIALMYLKYRLERQERIAFLGDRCELITGWPSTPAIVQGVLHLAACLQVLVSVWVLVSC
jgi:hypothetical protein